MINKYMRGMVYWAVLNNSLDDSIPTGERPVIIISNDVGNMFSKNLIVVPCTSNTNKIGSLPTHFSVQLYAERTSVALCESIQTIPKNKLNGFIGLLDQDTIAELDQKVKVSLGLNGENDRN